MDAWTWTWRAPPRRAAPAGPNMFLRAFTDALHSLPELDVSYITSVGLIDPVLQVTDRADCIATDCIMTTTTNTVNNSDER